jgi:hypothetical protein
MMGAGVFAQPKGIDGSVVSAAIAHITFLRRQLLSSLWFALSGFFCQPII